MSIRDAHQTRVQHRLDRPSVPQAVRSRPLDAGNSRARRSAGHSSGSPPFLLRSCTWSEAVPTHCGPTSPTAITRRRKDVLGVVRDSIELDDPVETVERHSG
jgi:hypothetical protein